MKSVTGSIFLVRKGFRFIYASNTCYTIPPYPINARIIRFAPSSFFPLKRQTKYAANTL
ncbi:hypothetical protein GQ55_3G309100 [Panicum hallii var. hallii]|uniref:Uncharacterized protein n=1 Tax=Panicum hallii var. hallii TaxID=1504633 RepID=A0A2T7EF45_9POAL|nr:hypothetical protein GQ55_3G309100 [Panicum hallii var. hallii]